MIFYFSGTGNSAWVARELGKQLGESGENIATRLMAGETSYLAKAGETIGIVFPVYAWAAPELVSDFAKGIVLDRDNFVFAVAVCGDTAGRAVEKLGKDIQIDSGFSVLMPNNYVVLFSTDTRERVEGLVLDARGRIPDIAERIRSRESVMDIKKGALPGLKTALIAPLFNRWGRSTKYFFAEPTCDGCRVCEKVCPVGVVTLEEGRPVWSGDCLQCLACLHYCPKKAIQYTKRTRKAGRYNFEKDCTGLLSD